MRRLVAVAAALGAACVAAALLVGGTASGDSPHANLLQRLASGQLQPAKITVPQTASGQLHPFTKTLPLVSQSTLLAVQQAVGAQAGDERDEGADRDGSIDIGQPGNLGASPGSLGCAQRDRGPRGVRGGGNVRVNQDCTFRRQAEEDITYNPLAPNDLVAGQNDSRVGYNQCGIDYSFDNGSHWGDMLPPFRSRTNNPDLMGPQPNDPNDNTIDSGPGTRHTYDAASDPANAVDAYGRAYFSCVVFDVASNASGLFVTQSPAYAGGSYYYNVPDAPFPPTAGVPSNKAFMVVEDNDGLILHDKNMISADRYRSSPNRGNVYVTWTVFKFGASCLGGTPTAPTECESPIYGSMSTDGGFTWSTPQEISGTSTTLCAYGNYLNPGLNPNACDFDQGSYSVTLPNGDLEVIFNNGNTQDANSQQLGVHCTPTGSSSAGTANLNCASPSLVGRDETVGEPLCDFGRGPEECVPGPYIRTNDFPRITKDNTQDNHLYAVWQDYRNGEYDIQLSMSTDGGLTWHEAGTVNPESGLDHYFPATDQSPDVNDLNGVSYYRSERVPGEADQANCLYAVSYPFTSCTPFTPGTQQGVQQGNSDYVLAGGVADRTPYDFKVVSPVFPPPDGNQVGFNGDYSGLTINKGANAHPIWSDTRNASPDPVNGSSHDEDVFTDSIGLPNGHPRHWRGAVGSH